MIDSTNNYTEISLDVKSDWKNRYVYQIRWWTCTTTMLQWNMFQVHRRTNVFFSLTNDVLSGRQSSAIARNNLFSTWTSSQRIQHELCPALSIVPFQIPKCYFSLSDICDDNQRNRKRFQMSMLFIQANIGLLKHTCYCKDFYIRKLASSKWKIHLGMYTRRRAADVARYIVR